MYLKWQEKTITDFSDANINVLYDRGFVFTRAGKGVMNQTRSLRIDLSKFELSSENRRVLKKTGDLRLTKAPLPYADYHWSIGKLGKDFYETKFGPPRPMSGLVEAGEGTSGPVFSANKMKELLTEPDKSNFNQLFIYHHEDAEKVGYCIVRETGALIHYCYPFYKLDTTLPNLGLGMMLHAILLAQSAGKKYVYLGSFQRPTDTYKLQFAGLEWWDGKKWQTDLENLKKTI